MGKKINDLIARTVERCQKRRRRVAPEGFFSVHVGADRQRFLVSMTCLNHPSFRLLLEDAESEFGFGSGDGPLVLPCHVDLFYRVLAQMEDHSPCAAHDADDFITSTPACGFACSPVRLRTCRSGSYTVLPAPSRMLNTN